MKFASFVTGTVLSVGVLFNPFWGWTMDAEDKDKENAVVAYHPHNLISCELDSEEELRSTGKISSIYSNFFR